MPIRKGVFETNSSSTHSICISSSDNLTDYLDIRVDGTLVLTGGQFGWEWRTYYDALTKANYCAVYALNCHRYDKDRVELEMLEKVLQEVTGAKRVKFCIADDYDCKDKIDEEGDTLHWSYIDHQSSSVCASAFSNVDRLKQFIFNPESVLQIGNDNEESRYQHRCDNCDDNDYNY